MINDKDEVIFKHGYAVELISTKNNAFLELTYVDNSIWVLKDDEIVALKAIIKRYEKAKTFLLLEQPIEILGLKTTTKNPLKASGILTIKDLVSIGEYNLKNMDLIGKSSFDDIKKCLSKFCLEIDMRHLFNN